MSILVVERARRCAATIAWSERPRPALRFVVHIESDRLPYQFTGMTAAGIMWRSFHRGARAAIATVAL
jgi:hypothetical protein